MAFDGNRNLRHHHSPWRWQGHVSCFLYDASPYFFFKSDNSFISRTCVIVSESQFPFWIFVHVFEFLLSEWSILSDNFLSRSWFDFMYLPGSFLQSSILLKSRTPSSSGDFSYLIRFRFWRLEVGSLWNCHRRLPSCLCFVYLLGGCVLRFLILLHLFGLSWVLLVSCFYLELSLLFRKKTLAMTKDLTAVTVLTCSRRHMHFSCVSNEVQRQWQQDTGTD